MQDHIDDVFKDIIRLAPITEIQARFNNNNEQVNQNSVNNDSQAPLASSISFLIKNSNLIPVDIHIQELLKDAMSEGNIALEPLKSLPWL